jgi:hypothetical protein
VAYPILRKHDVDYILVIFGGLLGYSGYVALLNDLEVVRFLDLIGPNTLRDSDHPQELVDVVSAEDEFGIMPTGASTKSTLRREFGRCEREIKALISAHPIQLKDDEGKPDV